MQAVDSQACGLYALMFLVHMSVGGTLDTFADIFSRHDFVKNDRRVAQWFQHLVERDLTWHRFKRFGQANYVPVRLLRAVLYKYRLSSFGREKKKSLKLSQKNGLYK